MQKPLREQRLFIESDGWRALSETKSGGGKVAQKLTPLGSKISYTFLSPLHSWLLFCGA